MKKKIKCLRCGKCCWYPDEHGLWHRCDYLAVDIKGFTTCTRYHKRLGTPVGDGVCIEDSRYNIPGCPFNRPDKIDHPFWEEK